MPFQYGEGK
jgi:hypothetical protein